MIDYRLCWTIAIIFGLIATLNLRFLGTINFIIGILLFLTSAIWIGTGYINYRYQRRK